MRAVGRGEPPAAIAAAANPPGARAPTAPNPASETKPRRVTAGSPSLPIGPTGEPSFLCLLIVFLHHFFRRQRTAGRRPDQSDTRVEVRRSHYPHIQPRGAAKVATTVPFHGGNQ